MQRRILLGKNYPSTQKGKADSKKAYDRFFFGSAPELFMESFAKLSIKVGRLVDLCFFEAAWPCKREPSLEPAVSDENLLSAN